MRSRLLQDGPTRIYAVVFEAGDHPMDGLVRFARDEGIDAAHLTAIGAFRHAVLGWFDIDAGDYVRNEVRRQSEVVSLVGDITAPPPGADDPKVHAHVVVALDDGRALGGHLIEATVRPTLEVVVTETPASLRRRHDPSTGLALIDLDSAGGPEPPVTPEGGNHGQDRR